MKELSKYDWAIILTITSLAWGGYELFHAFTPIRMIGFYGLIRSYSYKKYINDHFCKLHTLFAFWTIYNIVSLLWSYDITSWLIQLMHMTTMMGAFLIILVWLSKSQKPVYSICVGWLFFVLATLPIAFWELGTGEHLSSGSYNADLMGLGGGYYKKFAAVTFSNYNSYVTMLCFALPFILVLFNICGICLKTLVLFALGAIFYILCCNTSRGGALCFAIAILFFLTYSLTNNKSIYRILIPCALILLLVYGYKHFDELEIFIAMSGKLESMAMFEDESRVEVWGRAIYSTLYRFGVGSGCGSMVHTLQHDWGANKLAFCHNYFFETLLEYGFIITYLWFSRLIKIIVNLFRSTRHWAKYIGRYAIFTFPILLIIDDYYSQRTGVWIYFASIFGIWICERLQDEKKFI